MFSHCNCAPLTTVLSSGRSNLLVLRSHWQEPVEVFIITLALRQIGGGGGYYPSGVREPASGSNSTISTNVVRLIGGVSCRGNTWSSSIEARGEIQFLAHIPDPSSSRSFRGSTPICIAHRCRAVYIRPRQLTLQACQSLSRLDEAAKRTSSTACNSWT